MSTIKLTHTNKRTVKINPIPKYEMLHLDVDIEFGDKYPNAEFFEDLNSNFDIYIRSFDKSEYIKIGSLPNHGK